MNIQSCKLSALILTGSAMLLAVPVSRAQSSYSNAVMSLKPVAYWPLQENVQPPRYDMETNYGSLGSIANGYYYSSAVIATNVGAILGDTDGSRNFLSGGNAGMLVPTTDNRVSLAAGQPFTVECWVRATEASGYSGIINQTAGIGSGGLNGSANDFGWSLVQNYAAYRGTASPNSPSCFGFHVFSGNGNLGGAEVELTNAAAGEWLTGGAAGYQNSWVYLVSVFDGTNGWMYMYSTNLAAAYGGTNAIVYQIPIDSAGGEGYFGGNTVNSPNWSFAPDTWDPIVFGETRNYNGNHNFGGFIDEVAIYTNALTFLQISNHFNAATNGLGQYYATVTGDNPFMYWRMDAPKWTPVLNGLPPAVNYGSAAAGMTNFNTGGQGADAGVYQPGTLPGAAGPAYPGFGTFTNACAFNGLVGAVDAGYNKLLDPVGVSNNFTLVGWFRGNPMDTLGGRYNCMASHSDKSWKAQMKLGTVYGYEGVGTQPNIPPSTFNANDGKWHMYALEAGTINGAQNVAVYLDAGLYNSVALNTNPIPGNAIDAWIGGAPDSTYIEPTNESTYQVNEQYFAGEVAHVAYFTNILTFSQLQTLYFTAQPAPTIFQQPVSAVVGLNSAFTNSVAVEGSAPYSYQWFTNGVAIGNATNSSFIINPVAFSNADTNYYVVITNAFGSVTSSVVSLSVVSSVVFEAQYPISYTSPIILYGGTNSAGTNYTGSTPTFSVNVAGAPPISYQWLANGQSLESATNSSLTFTNCQLNSPTNFYCVVTNAFGAVTSMVWSITYHPAPTAPFPQAVLAAQPVGYWRLNEGPDNEAGNDGTICDDYESGNNGQYTNVVLANALGGTGYNPVTDPTETSTLFGQVTPAYAGLIQTNLDFSTPVGGNGEFTVATWANGDANQIRAQAANGGLVSKGHWGAEQFTLDEGAPGNDLRFTVRDALTGNYYSAASTVNLGSDANWHFVVGVCDETNSLILLYVDGQLAGSGTLAEGSGVLSIGAVPIEIGARDSAVAIGGEQFNGFLDDVAIYNYAFTSNQVVAMYNIGGIPPFFIHEPVNGTNVDGGSTLTITPTIGGSPLLSYQWHDASTQNPIAGQTNLSLVISNIQSSENFYLTVSNGFGVTNSGDVSVAVYTGAPQLSVNVQSPFFALLGKTATNSATVYGEIPLAYHWQYSINGTGWVSLTNNSQISGATNATLTIANAQIGNIGDYQLVVTNNSGSVTSSVAPLMIAGVLPLSFYGTSGAGWTANAGSFLSGGVLTLTGVSPATGNSTYFFQTPQYVGAFEASFTYQAQAIDTFPLADGITFCLQDDPRGAAATGGGGGDLGYTGITPSVALELNIYPGNGFGGTGYAFGEDGSLGQTTSPGAVILTNGLVDVSIHYADGQMGLSLSNEIDAAEFSTNIVVGDITQVLDSDTAYVGFTGSYGGDHSTQTIQNFQFVSIPPQDIEESKSNAVIIWPGAVVGYTLQENSSLTTTNWVTVPNAVVLTNGVYMVTVPIGNSHEYFRLALPLSQ